MSKKLEIDIIEFFRILLDKKKSIIKIVILFGIIGVCISLLLNKEYETGCKLLPELESGQSKGLGNLGGLAGLVGINLDEILANPGSKYDLILQEGDVISVPKHLQTVRLRGEFLYPITARFDEKLGFKNYMAQAGGFTDKAKKGKTYIIYANGSVDRTKRLLIFGNKYPKVQPGAEIIVPSKPDKEPLSAQAWIAIATSVVTFALVIERLIN